MSIGLATKGVISPARKTITKIEYVENGSSYGVAVTKRKPVIDINFKRKKKHKIDIKVSLVK